MGASTKFVSDPRNKKVFISAKNIKNNTKRGIRQGFFQLGHDLVRTARKQVLEKPKSGRVYRVRRGKVTRRHRASAPGESPANLSGDYRNTFGFKIRGANSMQFGAGGDGVDYAKFLEDGTSKMRPRPGLGNAVKATERNAMHYFANGIKRNLRK